MPPTWTPRFSGCFWIFEFFRWISGSGRCPNGEISKFWSRWAPGEPEMTLNCSDQAQGQFPVFKEFILLFVKINLVRHPRPNHDFENDRNPILLT